MNKELLFAKTLEQVRQLAKEQGNCVSEEQVQEAFAPLEFDNDQLQMVFDYLVKHKVGINQPVEIDDYLTDEEKSYLEIYLEEIQQLPTYTEGQRQAYTISAMAGEVSAQNKLVEIFLPEVVDIAKLYVGQGVLLEDLIGEGNLALTFGTSMLGGLENASEAQGALVQMVMNAMETYIEENASNEKADQKVADKVNRVMEKAKELAEDLQRKVTPRELAEETSLSLKSILDAIRMSGNQIDYIDFTEGKD